MDQLVHGCQQLCCTPMLPCLSRGVQPRQGQVLLLAQAVLTQGRR